MSGGTEDWGALVWPRTRTRTRTRTRARETMFDKGLGLAVPADAIVYRSWYGRHASAAVGVGRDAVLFRVGVSRALPRQAAIAQGR